MTCCLYKRYLNWIKYIAHFMYPILTYIYIFFIYRICTESDTEKNPNCPDSSNHKTCYVITFFFVEMILSFEICLYRKLFFVYGGWSTVQQYFFHVISKC